MFTDAGNKEIRFRPIPGRVHPQGGSFKVRTKGRGACNHKIVTAITKQRHTVCGMRDKMAVASSSSKRGRFAVANGYVDRVLDAPVVNLTPPSPRPRRGLLLAKPCGR